MDFATNCELLAEVKEKVKASAEKIETYKTEIYEGIDNLSSSWSGDSFNAFKEKCHSYEGAIDSLVTILNAYAKMIENVEKESTVLVSDIRTKLESE